MNSSRRSWPFPPRSTPLSLVDVEFDSRLFVNLRRTRARKWGTCRKANVRRTLHRTQLVIW
jgi:hypothetical protein